MFDSDLLPKARRCQWNEVSGGAAPVSQRGDGDGGGGGGG